MWVILRVQGGDVVSLVAKVIGNLLGSDGQNLIAGERCASIMLYPIDEGHQLNEESSVCFSSFCSVHIFLCDF